VAGIISGCCLRSSPVYLVRLRGGSGVVLDVRDRPVRLFRVKATLWVPVILGAHRLWNLPGSGGGVPGMAVRGTGGQGVGERGDGGDEFGEGCGVVVGRVALASSPCGVGGLAPGGQVGDCFAERA